VASFEMSGGRTSIIETSLACRHDNCRNIAEALHNPIGALSAVRLRQSARHAFRKLKLSCGQDDYDVLR
jgi:hypothetical protein